jgi:hypothetical protein
VQFVVDTFNLTRAGFTFPNLSVTFIVSQNSFLVGEADAENADSLDSKIWANGTFPEISEISTHQAGLSIVDLHDSPTKIETGENNFLKIFLGIYNLLF